jgi:hypothetical protein
VKFISAWVMLLIEIAARYQNPQIASIVLLKQEDAFYHA